MFGILLLLHIILIADDQIVLHTNLLNIIN